jgi:hypothetical protein
MSGQSGIPGWVIAWIVFVAIVGVGSAIGRAVYRSNRGVSPFFAREQVEAAIVNSQMMQPAKPTEPGKTIEERLAELDGLHERGVITDDEWHEARSKAISDGQAD